MGGLCVSLVQFFVLFCAPQVQVSVSGRFLYLSGVRVCDRELSTPYWCRCLWQKTVLAWESLWPTSLTSWAYRTKMIYFTPVYDIVFSTPSSDIGCQFHVSSFDMYLTRHYLDVFSVSLTDMNRSPRSHRYVVPQTTLLQLPAATVNLLRAATPQPISRNDFIVQHPLQATQSRILTPDITVTNLFYIIQ